MNQSQTVLNFYTNFFCISTLFIEEWMRLLPDMPTTLHIQGLEAKKLEWRTLKSLTDSASEKMRDW